MDTNKPENTSESDARATNPIQTILRKIGMVVFIVGVVFLTYGAVAFWLINSLPPNGGANGRLPSLYLMAVGMIVTLIGLSVRGLPFGRQNAQISNTPKKNAYHLWSLYNPSHRHHCDHYHLTYVIRHRRHLPRSLSI